jgi:hypothetical protein
LNISATEITSNTAIYWKTQFQMQIEPQFFMVLVVVEAVELQSACKVGDVCRR